MPNWLPPYTQLLFYETIFFLQIQTKWGITTTTTTTSWTKTTKTATTLTTKTTLHCAHVSSQQQRHENPDVIYSVDRMNARSHDRKIAWWQNHMIARPHDSMIAWLYNPMITWSHNRTFIETKGSQLTANWNHIKPIASFTVARTNF